MKRVLLVEDSELVRSIVNDALQTCFPCVTTAVEDGGQAWEELGRNSYDLVVTDIMMPVMDGMALVRKIREELVSDIPIIMMTSLAVEKARESAFEAGANAYVTKPIDYNQLIEVVNNLVLPERDHDEEEPILLEDVAEEDEESEG
jgi:CheY-like chemotaxis protein